MTDDYVHELDPIIVNAQRR